MRAETLRTSRGHALAISAVPISAALALFASVPWSQPSGSAPIVSAINMEGNRRVETGAIRLHVSSKVEQPLDEAKVDDDLKAIYRMGFFKSVSADVKKQPDGEVPLILRVAWRRLPRLGVDW